MEAEQESLICQLPNGSQVLLLQIAFNRFTHTTVQCTLATAPCTVCCPALDGHIDLLKCIFQVKTTTDA